MVKYSPIPLGEKLMQIRKAKGLSQENVAGSVGSSVSTVSRIEQSQVECSGEMLAVIKKYMDIEAAPLFEHELKIYEDQLWIINELASAQRVSDARTMLTNMFPIEELPFELDLCLLYAVIDARMLFMEGDLPGGEARLKGILPRLDDAGNKVKHLYHSGMGYVCTMKNDDKAGLDHYLRALDFHGEQSTDVPLLYNIGNLYQRLNCVYRAVIYLERAKQASAGNRTTTYLPRINSALGICYNALRDHNKAIQLLERALAHARSLNDERTIAVTIGELITAHLKLGNAEEALRLVEQGLMLTTVQSQVLYLAPYHLRLLTDKAEALSMLKRPAQYQEALAEAKAHAKGDKIGTLLVETIQHLASIHEKNSCDYLENTAIPQFMAMGQTALHFYVIELCEALEAQYKKRGLNKKALAAAAIARDIYKEILFGKDDL